MENAGDGPTLLLGLHILASTVHPTPCRVQEPGEKMEHNLCLSSGFNPRPPGLQGTPTPRLRPAWLSVPISTGDISLCLYLGDFFPDPGPNLGAASHPSLCVHPPSRAGGPTLAALRAQCEQGTCRAAQRAQSPSPTHIKGQSQLSREGWGCASCWWSYPFDVDLSPPSCPGPENPAWSSFPGPTLTTHPASIAHIQPPPGSPIPSLQSLLWLLAGSLLQCWPFTLTPLFL